MNESKDEKELLGASYSPSLGHLFRVQWHPSGVWWPNGVFSSRYPGPEVVGPPSNPGCGPACVPVAAKQPTNIHHIFPASPHTSQCIVLVGSSASRNPGWSIHAMSMVISIPENPFTYKYSNGYPWFKDTAGVWIANRVFPMNGYFGIRRLDASTWEEAMIALFSANRNTEDNRLRRGPKIDLGEKIFFVFWENTLILIRILSLR